MLVLYGCKRHLLDPLNPQTQLPPKVKLDKVKGFYENGRYKNQPKRSSGSGNERMTSADSARFKDFEPQWDKTEVELLPNNQKMLIVPVVRFLQVDYNENIGFIRRLCIRVDANDDFLEANIVELVGSLIFVKENHNAIFKNYKENNISGFSGSIIRYQLDYDQVSYTGFENGTGTNTSGDLTTVFEGMCAKIFGDDGTLIFESCIGSGDSGGGGGESGGSGSGSGGGSSNPPGCPCGVASCPPCPIIAVPSNTGTSNPPYQHTPFTPHAPSEPGYTPGNNPSGTTGNTGTIGGGGGNGQYNPPPVVIPFVPPPPPPMPHPGMIWISDLGWIDPPPPPTTVDIGCSFCGNDWGDGVPRDADGYEIVVNTAIEDPDGILTAYLQDMKDGLKTNENIVNGTLTTSNVTAAQKIILRDDVIPEQKLAIAEANEMMKTTKATFLVKYTTNNANGGSTYYDPATGKIVMEVMNPNLPNAPKDSWRNTAHEMKHGSQFLEGKTSFNKTTGAAGVLCDINDEIEAYRRECILAYQRHYKSRNIAGAYAPPYVVFSLSVISYGNTFSPSLGYQNLPSNLRDITTSEGVILINQGVNTAEIFVQP